VPTSSQLTESFMRAVEALEHRFRSYHLADADAAIAVHAWLDGINGSDRPLPWADPTSLTADEWFFVTTLNGRMTVWGQRAHIRSFFEPLFVRAARRNDWGSNCAVSAKKLEGQTFQGCGPVSAGGERSDALRW